MAEAFLERCAARLAKAAEARSIMAKEFLPRWRNRLVTEIAPREAAEAIRAIAERGAPYQAYNAFGWLRRFYNWAINSGEHGVDASPLARLSARDIIGQPKEPRSRILTDTEVRALWTGSERLGYPFGPVFQLLLITGQREREVADASWEEFDLENRLWTIPKARMKGDRAHEVPLSDSALKLIKALPRFGGKYLFSSTGGKKPVSGFSKAKIKIGALMATEMELGAEQAAAAIQRWVIHDIRRTVRTHLSALPVQDNVRELVKAQYEAGQKAGSAMVTAVDAYLDPRLVTVCESLLKVFKDRLRDMEVPPEFTHQQVAQVEFKIFLEHLEEFTPRIQQEVAENLSDWFELATTIGTSDELARYVKQKLDTAKLDVMATAIDLTGEAVIQAQSTAAASGATS